MQLSNSWGAFLLLTLIAVSLPAIGQTAAPLSTSSTSATMEASVRLYNQRNYAAALDSFERIIKTQPSARACYYAALSNQACGKDARAGQLFRYIVTSFPRSQESAYAQQMLRQVKSGPVGKEQGSEENELPDSIKNALSPNLRELINTPAGKRQVEEFLKENAADVRAIRKAEKDGVLTKEKIAAATAPTALATKTLKISDHPFTAADIAKSGAAGIDQSRYPNCWFEASVAALAELPRGQRLIANMIRCKDRDKYTIRFPNDGVEYLISQQDLDNAQTKDNALWASIIECAQTKKFPQDQGAYLEVGLGTLTGVKADVVVAGSVSKQELSSFIGGAVKSQNPIVADTFPGSYLAALPDLVVPLHAYTIIGFDPARSMVTLRNPHGRHSQKFSLESDPRHEEFEPLSNGVFKINLTMFQKYFRFVARSFI